MLIINIAEARAEKAGGFGPNQAAEVKPPHSGKSGLHPRLGRVRSNLEHAKNGRGQSMSLSIIILCGFIAVVFPFGIITSHSVLAASARYRGR
jgi:hypothetical protein